jgi:hypothetical protein
VNGQSVDEITVDGDVVFSAVPESRLDDFSSNTLNEYITRDTRDDDTGGNWSISNGKLTAPDTNRDELIVYDADQELNSTSKIAVEADIVSTPDNDGIAVGIANSSFDEVYDLIVSNDYLTPDQPTDLEGIGKIDFGTIASGQPSSNKLADWNKSLSGTNNLRLEYDGTTLVGYHNGNQEISATVSFTPRYAGVHSLAHSPGPSFDNLLIEYDF